jgi:hypothetical protein
MTYQELIKTLKDSDWKLKCKPEDAVEFKDFDFWYLTKERKSSKWEIETQKKNIDNLIILP